MLKLKVRVLMFGLAVGTAAGVYSSQPVAAVGGSDCSSACCTYTSDCGSALEWRCCLPKTGEAPCAPEPCPTYCIYGTSCNPGF